MFGKYSRSAKIVLGARAGLIVGIILSFGFGDYAADFLVGSFGFSDLEAGIFVLLVLVPTTGIVGTIVGGLIVSFLSPPKGRNPDN